MASVRASAPASQGLAGPKVAGSRTSHGRCHGQTPPVVGRPDRLASLSAGDSPPGFELGVEIACRVYRPRRPRESPLYQLVERHLEELLRVWPERFARRHGPLRAVVERVLRGFLKCGLLEHGFARLWCGECRRGVLVAFSCRGRSFCPSCEKKQLLWAEWLRDEVLAEVAHRHVVLTIPRLLRPVFRRRRELLTELARAGAEAVQELVRVGCGREARPGLVVSVASAGDLLQWHPHLHLLTTDGGRTGDGAWRQLEEWDGPRLMALFRERLLARLLEARAISKELVAKLVGWRHPGFSAHVGERIAREDKQRLEDTAAYLVRNPLLCGGPHRRGYADLAIMRSSRVLPQRMAGRGE